MKSILFASTALVAFAGAAAAQGVSLTGLAEMGIYNSDGHANDNGDDTEFFSDIDVTFTLSGETDNGLTFGASVDLDEADQLANEDQDADFTVFISGAFGTLTMGDTDGALDWAITDASVGSAGSINDDETEHNGYLGGNPFDSFYDGQILRYDNTFGAFGVALSAQIDDGRDAAGAQVVAPAVSNQSDPVIGIGFRYALDLGGSTVNFGLGYESTSVDAVGAFTRGGVARLPGDYDAVGFSVAGTFSGVSAALSYISVDGPVAAATFNYDHVGIGLGYTTGPITVAANYGNFDYDDGDEKDGYALTAGYDLGGGASILFGYSDGTTKNGPVAGVGVDESSYSLGVSMSF
ncbi:MAG: porin [Jannaschia sp.]